MSTSTPFVEHTLELSSKWHPVAAQRLINFFEQRGQLKNAYRAERGEWRLVVRFTDDKQADAFRLALAMGHLPKGGPAMG